jgi:putative transposase
MKARSLPKAIHLDSGSKLRSAIFIGWCEERRIALQFIKFSYPQQNSSIERVNLTYSLEVLNAYISENLSKVLKKLGS